ncbi:hypothetical protein A7P98_03100 [Eikenella sp. NML080894]|nr:hypothetical protein A7P98_03100 [Eikenella sp. NML080894]OAM46157.1 hypothetical protein A7Q03_02440 [Eikenella sp. NML99-0057]
MYGLAIIFLFFFSLILWIVLTRLAVKFGRKIFTRMLPQYGWAGKAGAFAGFMLLMGGWIVKWKIENWQAVRHAEEACKKNGGMGICGSRGVETDGGRRGSLAGVGLLSLCRHFKRSGHALSGNSGF